MTDGVFDEEGNFHPIPGIDQDKAMLFFREKVFEMLKDNSRISNALIEKMRNWHHSGFSVHNEVFIKKDNPDALERLAQYIVHSSVGLFLTFQSKNRQKRPICKYHMVLECISSPDLLISYTIYYGISPWLKNSFPI